MTDIQKLRAKFHELVMGECAHKGEKEIDLGRTGLRREIMHLCDICEGPYHKDHIPHHEEDRALLWDLKIKHRLIVDLSHWYPDDPEWDDDVEVQWLDADFGLWQSVHGTDPACTVLQAAIEIAKQTNRHHESDDKTKGR